MSSFDKFSEKYDTRFLNNRNVLMSELLLIEKILKGEGKILSVRCGGGFFESLLRERGITIEDCIEPSEMGKIVEARGLRVKRGYAEGASCPEKYDIVLINGVIHYLRDPAKSLLEANRVLREGGHLLGWVAGEGSYRLLYRLASLVDWKELEGVSPKFSYPLEFVREAKWQTVEEVRSLLRNAGFEEVLIMQTLTKHPKYSNDEAEYPSQGYDREEYLCIKARKR